MSKCNHEHWQQCENCRPAKHGTPNDGAQFNTTPAAERWPALAASFTDKHSTAPGVPFDPLKPASERQVGGDHYTKLKIQPMHYSLANRLDAAQHTIIKYVTRFRDKGGLADLQKARHTLDLLIEYETEASRDR